MEEARIDIIIAAIRVSLRLRYQQTAKAIASTETRGRPFFERVFSAPLRGRKVLHSS